MLNLYFVNGEMWQKRYPTKAWGQSFEDQWRRLAPWEPVFRARITFRDHRDPDALAGLTRRRG